MNSGGRGARDDRINFEAKGLARISAHGTLVGRIIHGRGEITYCPAAARPKALRSETLSPETTGILLAWVYLCGYSFLPYDSCRRVCMVLEWHEILMAYQTSSWR